MTELLMSLVLAFGISFYALPALIHVAKRKKLYDIPDNRKVHNRPIPALGGLAIYAGFITSFLLTVTFSGELYTLQYVVAASLIMFFIGLKDDLLNITALKKFLGQALAASLLVLKAGLVISSMHGIFGIYDLQPVAANSITIFTIVVIINAFNLIDGVDGLAGSLAYLSAAFFAVYFAINQDWAFACMATSLIGGLTAFLIFNFPPARMFMGDTGSLTLGLINSVLVIRFIQTGDSAPIWNFEATAAMAFSVLFIPLFDTFRVFSYRILTGTPPFTPDKNHIHHILLRLGLNHLQVTGALCFSALAIFGLAYLLQGYGNFVVLAVTVSLAFFATAILIYKAHKLEAKQIEVKPPLKLIKKKGASTAAPERKVAN